MLPPKKHSNIQAIVQALSVLLLMFSKFKTAIFQRKSKKYIARF